jgi:hypothetical protein
MCQKQPLPQGAIAKPMAKSTIGGLQPTPHPALRALRMTVQRSFVEVVVSFFVITSGGKQPNDLVSR